MEINNVFSCLLDFFCVLFLNNIQEQEASTPLPLASVPVQNFGQGGQNQYAFSQPTQAHTFSPNVQTQQAVPPMTLHGQMRQAAFSSPQSGQGQLVPPQAPSNCNIAMQNLPVVPPYNMGLNHQAYIVPLADHGGQTHLNFNLWG